VTGDTGFKGSWLALLLEQAGAEVAGFALPAETSSLSARLGRPRAPWSVGDVREPHAVAEAFRQLRPEVVFHLAAQPLVRRSYREPIETFSTNVQGTAVLLEAARRCDATRAIVVVTSDKCYRNDGSGRSFREDDPLGGEDPYSASKAAAEMVAASYRRSFFERAEPPVGLATARAGNVLGGGDWAEDRLVPDLVRALQSRRPLVLRNPGAVRPWQHVLDVCFGYALLGEALLRDARRTSGAWNFAPDAAGTTVRDLVAHLLRAWDVPHPWPVEEVRAAEPEAPVLRLDAARARAELGWRPRLGPEETILWTVDWFRRLGAGASARELCAGQLAEYLRRVETESAA
jgi:CDP-glucose 4,6-dehydratase